MKQKRLIIELKNTLQILVGLLLCALAYRMYLIPNDIVPGGFTGIGQVANELFPRVSIGTVTLLLNVPLFLFSIRSMGLGFGVRSLLASVGLSLLLDHLNVGAVTDDVLLATIFGGVLGGIGFGLVLRGNASTGGSDMLGVLLNRLFHFVKINVAISMVDGLVVIASGIVFDASAAMYALSCIVVMNSVLDIVVEGANRSYSHIIISNKGEQIAERVMRELARGVTKFSATGMYSGQERTVLLCVMNRLESIRLRRIVFCIDPNAFMIAQNAHEVLGEGFKNAQVRTGKP